MAAYGIAIFTGAFLLFQVQPLMAKFLLPWFGGATGVWTACMLFFQVVLLGGYAYAHLLSRLRLRAQVVAHLALVVVAIATLPITPTDSWKPTVAQDPTWRILLLLLVSVGLPYFVLSATAPLLQKWFSYARPGFAPYRLYALSNAGSLLALLSYPVLVETWLTRTAQATFWGAGLVVYAVLCAWAAKSVWNISSQATADQTADNRPGSVRNLAWLWILFPACGSILLLAITNKMCQDVAVVAFLWVLPLALYLASFIICFEKPTWYRREWFGIALMLALGLAGYALTGGAGLSVPLQIALYSAVLFVCCMVCHGEVYRLRPGPEQLTAFYLCISAGGALGGAFVALAAPRIFPDYYELYWGLLACGALFLFVRLRDEASGGWKGLRPIWLLTCVGLVVLAFAFWVDARKFASVRAYRARSFYGVLNVYRHTNQNPALSLVEMMHGRVAHGMQFADPGRSRMPTLYFTQGSGAGGAFSAVRHPFRAGVVGLGAGTLAAYAKAGDAMKFYEINPDVEYAAKHYFTFLTNSPAQISVQLGDARVSLENEPAQNFDLLVLDAFNSDSIPVHLLTAEAFQLYRRHVKPDGAIAIHISNMSLDLEPVVASVADRFGYIAATIESRGAQDEWWVLPSTWMLLSTNKEFLMNATSGRNARAAVGSLATAPHWTDDFSGLFRTLRWGEFFGTKKLPTFEYVAARASFSSSAEVAALAQQLRESLKTNLNSALVLNNLAVLLATASDPAMRNGTEAVQMAEKACSLTSYGNAVMLTTLGAAYAEAGRFPEAIQAAEAASALAKKNGETPLIERNRELLELYRKQQPYHQPSR